MNAPAHPPGINAALVEELALGKHPNLERDLVMLARGGELRGVVQKPARYSATTIQWTADCERKFYWPAVAGLDSLPSSAQAFGTNVHKIQEDYLLKNELPPRHTQEGILASVGLPLLPKPGAAGLYVEQPFDMRFEGLPVTITGTRDFGVDPTEKDAKGFLLGDHKTARSRRWPKTKLWLRDNIQANLYAFTKHAELYAKGFDRLNIVDKQWIYYFKDERQADKLRQVDSLDHVGEQFETVIKPLVLRMAAMVAEAPKVSDIPLPADRSVCDAYGGCPHRARCFGMGTRENENMGPGAGRFSKAGISARIEDLTGQLFGRYIVVARDLTVASGDGVHARWLVRCSCGAEKSIDSNTLKLGRTQSCGCFKAERDVERHTTHGLSDSPEYGVWKAMINRCTSENNTQFKDYGGRGISVCERWEKFDAFYEDMGPRTSDTHTLERNDNDGNYEPENCRWATRSEQARNKRPRAAKEVPVGVLAGKFTKQAITAQVASGAAAAINPPPPKPWAKPGIVTAPEEQGTIDEGTEPIQVEPAEEKPKRGRPKAEKPAGAEALVAQVAAKTEVAFAPRTPSKSLATPGSNPAHDFWLLVGTRPSKGFDAVQLDIESILGSAQASATAASGKDHFRLDFGGHALLEASFASYMEENPLVGAICVPAELSPGLKDVIGLLRAHAAVVFE